MLVSQRWRTRVEWTFEFCAYFSLDLITRPDDTLCRQVIGENEGAIAALGSPL